MDCYPLRIISRRRVKNHRSAQFEKSAACTDTEKASCNVQTDGGSAGGHETMPCATQSVAGVDCTCSDPALDNLIRHLDNVGHAVEVTFKEVDSIDAYVSKLRCDFDLDRVNEHRFMTCMVKARIAREACCRRQVQKWRELSQGMLKLYSAPASDHAGPCDTPGVATRYPDQQMNAFLCRLSKMSTLKNVIQRLDPGQDVRSFVERWVLPRTPSSFS